MKVPHHTVLITSEHRSERLDKALALLLPQITRTRLQSLIALGHVTRESAAGRVTVTDGASKVKPGNIYTVTVPEVEPAELKAQAIALNVVFEDAHFLVIDKPAGMVAHPAPGHPDSTLVNALLAHCGESLSGIGGVARPGLLHRIDKDTSGLLVVAKHDAAYQALSAQLAARTLKRTYLAVCHGVPVPAAGTVTGPIGRHPHHRQKMAVLASGGKHAVTHYKVVEVLHEGAAALLECRLETGRTHQIRVHMAHIRHPLVGDAVYGRKSLPSFSRQALHAWKLALAHPVSGKAMEFEAPLPADMQALIHRLRGGVG